MRSTIDEIVAALQSLAKQTPATTIAGLQVRAAILNQIRGEVEENEEEPDDETGEDDECTDELMIRAIVRDLMKIKV